MQFETVESDKHLLNSVVAEVIGKLLSESFKTTNFNYKIRCATAKGENYIGIVYRITANDQENKKKIRYIVEVPPQNQLQFLAKPCFVRETLAYKKFLPMINEFQRSKGIMLYDKRFHEYVDCYFTLSVAFHEAIIMEDLAEHGFKLFDRFKEFDEHVGIVMRAYAKLHAVSLAIKDQAPEKLEKFKNIDDIFEGHKNDEGMIYHFENIKDITLKSLCPKTHAKYYDI